MPLLAQQLQLRSYAHVLSPPRCEGVGDLSLTLAHYFDHSVWLGT